MAFIKLVGGYYTSRSIPAAAQRCVNLYPEATIPTADEPIMFWEYETPGLKFIKLAPEEICRCLYRASNGDLYAAFGQGLYYIDADANITKLGTFTGSHLSDVVPSYNPVSMTDNGDVLLIVMNTADGWTLDLATRGSFTRINAGITNTIVLSATSGTSAGVNYTVGDSLTLDSTGGALMSVLTVDANGAILTQQIVYGGNVATEVITPVNVTGGTGSGANFILQYSAGQPNAGFTGGSFAAYQDSFFILNDPGTNQFYVSGSGTATFDPLQVETKNAWADPIQAVVSVHRVLWLIGTQSYEVWYNSGGNGTILNDFPFSLIPSAFANYGAVALYSIQASDNELYFLSSDSTGKGIMLQGQSDYSTKRISTHAVENEWATYPRIDDAYSSIHQMNGHSWYMITFPSANNYRGKTWCFDSTTNIWHERTFTDMNGLEWRHRAGGNAVVQAYGKVWVGDWATNALYQFDLDTYNDFGYPIVRKRTFQHNVDLEGQRRISYRQLSLFMDTGNANQEVIEVPLIYFSAAATDGTLLQDYSNITDLGATFTKLSGTTDAEILNDTVIGVSNGSALYEINTKPSSSDYNMTYKISLASFHVPIDTNNFIVIARANPSNNGYKASISSDGSSISLNLTVMGAATTTVDMGSLASGYYEIFFDINGSTISLGAFRSSDGTWLASNGTWATTETTAISIIDTTYTLAGNILVGGSWIT